MGIVNADVPVWPRVPDAVDVAMGIVNAEVPVIDVTACPVASVVAIGMVNADVPVWVTVPEAVVVAIGMVKADVPVWATAPAATVVAIGMVNSDVPVTPAGAVHQKNIRVPSMDYLAKGITPRAWTGSCKTVEGAASVMFAVACVPG